jgi:hypothetical protein
VKSIFLHDCGLFCLCHFLSPHLIICHGTQNAAGEHLKEVYSATREAGMCKWDYIITKSKCKDFFENYFTVQKTPTA